MSDQQRGAALIIATWLVALGSVLAFNFAMTTRTETSVTATTVAHHQARAAAEAGIWRSIYEMVVSEPSAPIATDSSLVEFEFNNATVRVFIQDTLGLADLNRSDPSTLVELIGYALDDFARAAIVVDRIVDWRDQDDRVSLNGAEADDYRVAGHGYVPKNGPFNTREELELIMGLSREEYERIAPFVTVFSGERSVTVGVAPGHVRDALAVERRPDALHGSSRSTIVPGPHRGTFEIRSEAKFNGAVSRVAATVKIDPRTRGGSPATMLAWRESWPVGISLKGSDEITVAN